MEFANQFISLRVEGRLPPATTPPPDRPVYSNFLLGGISTTEKAFAALGRVPLDLVARHAVNEHGLATARELKQNAIAMKTGGPIISRYYIDPTNPRKGKVVVITTKSWGATQVQLETECSAFS